MLLLKIMFWVAIAGGLAEWLLFDRAPWEGLGAAGIIAGAIKFVESVKGARRIVEDYETRLTAIDSERVGADARVKAEHERFANGDVQFVLRVYRVTLPDGTALEVMLDRGQIGTMELRDGMAELRLDSREGVAVPAVTTGHRIVIAHAGEPLFAGVFQPD